MAASRKPKPRSEINVKALRKSRRGYVFCQVTATDTQIAFIAGILAALILALVTVKSYFGDTARDSKPLSKKMIRHDRNDHGGPGNQYANNLKQLGLAHMKFEGDVSCFSTSATVARTLSGTAIMRRQESWNAFPPILPFIEQNAPYNAMNGNAYYSGFTTAIPTEDRWYVEHLPLFSFHPGGGNVDFGDGCNDFHTKPIRPVT